MLETDRSESWRRAFRVELRAEAIGLAFRGWPVLPGTYPAGEHWAGREGVEDTGPVPVHRDWQERIGTKAEQVATWWTGRPYSLLLATGKVYDAIEVDDDLGRRAAGVLRSVGLPVPIIATPDRRWFFLTQSGAQLSHELAADPTITLHADGSWITLPPSPFQHGVVHWRVKPEVCGWEIPTSRTVQDALLDALQEPTRDRLVTQLIGAD
ncbi:bifunctional DNA primase/polymerase [Actinokineospora xionganensis]|uniref:Bifunctional DNA primase/polymerase n=1 Tax=Actinokineospora xionganensis TaxID=2684470 RepID=A0ABR7L2V3_9PSEU|nr:bifunctional DNA primase/polymerase [Actinokineospora xionganensis]MBC6447013.1 bifunctional DNA primase/polymerase [Actinokineospora xionganensis]